MVSALDREDRVLREGPSLEARRVDPAERRRVALREREGRHVLPDLRAAAHEGARPDADELVEIAVEAAIYTADGLVAAIERYYSKS